MPSAKKARKATKKTASDVAPTGRVEHRTRGENCLTTYANSVTVARSFYDFRIVFGQLESATTEEITVTEVAHVFMSPEHMKALARVLAVQVEEYEALFGPIATGPIDQGDA